MMMLADLSVYTYIYIAAALLSALGFFLISSQKASQEQLDIVKVTLFSTIAIVAYALRSAAITEDVALIAQKMLIFGSCFNYWYYFLFYMRFCKIKAPKWFYGVFFALTISIFLATFTFDYHTLTYSEWEWAITSTGNLQLHVIDRNIFGYLYLYNYVIYYTAMIVVTALSFRNFTKRRKRIAIALLVLPLLPDLGQTLSTALLRGTAIELTPIGLVLSQFFLLFLIYKVHIYDANLTISSAVFRNVKSVLIAFSDDYTYLGANEMGIRLFPYLSKLSINEPIRESDMPELYKIITGDLNEYSFAGKIYEASFQDADNKGTKLLWLNDVTEEREYVDLLQNYQQDLMNEVDEKTQNIKDMQVRVMMSLSDILENRDGNTGGHVKRTSKIVELLVKAMYNDNYPNVTAQFCDLVAFAAPMHDIGKIAVSDVILNKPAKLTDEEFDIMKSHSEKGANLAVEVLYGVETPSTVHITESIARSHHEKWDGTGYPEHLKGEDIPLEARIMAVADVYDALVSKRCYKDPMPFDVAYKIMDESFGSHFDPSLKKYFDACRPEIEAYYTSTY